MFVVLRWDDLDDGFAGQFGRVVAHYERLNVMAPEATEMVLRDDGGEMFVDMQRRPQHYRNIVHGIRQHLARHHSQMVRLRELVDIIET